MPQALRNIRSVRAYIAQFSPRASERVAERITAAGDGLAELPSRGRDVGGGRRELVAAPPYLLLYRIRGDVVEILTVRHAARRRY